MLKKLLIGAGVIASTASIQAFAALPAVVATAVTDGTADGKELGYALLGMAVVVGIVFWLKRKA